MKVYFFCTQYSLNQKDSHGNATVKYTKFSAKKKYEGEYIFLCFALYNYLRIEELLNIEELKGISRCKSYQMLNVTTSC